MVMILEHFYGADRKLQRPMYDLRRKQFSEFSSEEQMVFWQFDPLCEHFGVFDGETPLGFVSVGDYTQYPDVHHQFGLDKLIEGYSPSLRIKGVHRLASTGNPTALKILLMIAQEETKKNCDFFFGYTAPSKNMPNDTSRQILGEKYCSLSGAQPLGTRTHQGVEQHFFGKWM